MGTVLIVITVFIGTIAAVLLVAFLIYVKIKSVVPKELQSKENIQNIVSAGRELKNSVESTPKKAGGITTFLLPTIQKDFTDFNINEFYSIVESNLRKVFNVIEQKDINLITPDLEQLKDNLIEQLKDINDNNIKIRYDDVIFHEHALRDYEKKDGIATITVSSSVEYYYYYEAYGKRISNMDTKKQTRYLSKYIYVYDKNKLNTTLNLIGLNCPNCGAPLKGFNKTVCEYCGTHTIELNLKSWKFISYKED